MTETDKCCHNCRWCKFDRGSNCHHPKLKKWDDVVGHTPKPCGLAVQSCRLHKWERKQTVLDWLARVFGQA